MLSKLLAHLIESRFIDKTSLENYHFTKYTQNVYGNKMCKKHVAMFDSGSGKELKTKATAVYSSSMLAYNFFHWISSETTFRYEDVVYNEVFFEIKIPTISKSPAPANLDIVLVSEDKSTWLLLESKFTEHFHPSSYQMTNLSNGYFDLSRYLFESQIDAKRIVQLVKEWNEKGKKDDTQYYDGIKQLLCHLIAILNLKKPSPRNKILEKVQKLNPGIEELPQKVILRTILFSPNSVYKEYVASKAYENLCKQFYDSARNAYPDLDVGVITYSEMWGKMASQIKDQNLIAYLTDRYLRCADMNTTSH